MPSAIDPTKPGEGAAYTEDVRLNFAAAASEIGALQTTVASLQTTITSLQADIVALKARQQHAATVVTPDPPNTNSTVFVMAGINVSFTPQGTRGFVIVDGEIGNTQNASVSEAQLTYGQGPPPSVGTLLSATNGVLIGESSSMQSSRAGDFAPFSLAALLTDIVSGTPHWFGVAYRAQSGTCTLSSMSLTAFEILDPLS